MTPVRPAPYRPTARLCWASIEVPLSCNLGPPFRSGGLFSFQMARSLEHLNSGKRPAFSRIKPKIGPIDPINPLLWAFSGPKRGVRGSGLLTKRGGASRMAAPLRPPCSKVTARPKRDGAIAWGACWTRQRCSLCRSGIGQARSSLTRFPNAPVIW
jgi:hypothetical protein